MQQQEVSVNLLEVIDSVEDELLVVDGEYCVKFVNSSLRRRLPEDAESPIGRYCYEVVEGRDSPCSAPLWDCPLQEVIQSGSPTTSTRSPHHGR